MPRKYTRHLSGSGQGDVLPALVRAHDSVQAAQDAETVARIVRETSLPREGVPPEWQNDKAVWDALLVDMPMHAMIRTLNRMTQAGLLADAGTLDVVGFDTAAPALIADFIRG